MRPGAREAERDPAAVQLKRGRAGRPQRGIADKTASQTPHIRLPPVRRSLAPPARSFSAALPAQIRLSLSRGNDRLRESERSTEFIRRSGPWLCPHRASGFGPSLVKHSRLREGEVVMITLRPSCCFIGLLAALAASAVPRLRGGFLLDWRLWLERVGRDLRERRMQPGPRVSMEQLGPRRRALPSSRWFPAAPTMCTSAAGRSFGTPGNRWYTTFTSELGPS